jgi:hypothetical protein
MNGKSIAILDFEALSHFSDFEKSYLIGGPAPHSAEATALGEFASHGMEQRRA